MKFIKKLMISALTICLLLANITVVSAEEGSDDKTYFFSSTVLDSLTGSNVFNLELAESHN